MQIDLKADKAMIAQAQAPRTRRPWLHLLSAVMELAGPWAELLHHTERPWASITFSGSRHMITLVFEGLAGLEAGDIFIAALPEHEFAVPGQLVADAAVIAAEHVLLPEVRLEVEIELLLLEER
jgi:hypothetical protein